MKNITKFMLFVAITFAAISCSKENQDIDKANIVGTWNYLTASTDDGKTWVDVSSLQIIESYKEDMTFVQSAMVGGQKINYSGTYSWNGNKLLLDIKEGEPKQVVTYTILELTNSRIKVQVYDKVEKVTLIYKGSKQ